jgi:hypothetical protein
MIEYYDRLEEVDQELIAINEWQQEEIKKLYAETEKRINAALLKLGEQIPSIVKEKKQDGDR